MDKSMERVQVSLVLAFRISVILAVNGNGHGHLYMDIMDTTSCNVLQLNDSDLKLSSSSGSEHWLWLCIGSHTAQAHTGCATAVLIQYLTVALLQCYHCAPTINIDHCSHSVPLHCHCIAIPLSPSLCRSPALSPVLPFSLSHSPHDHVLHKPRPFRPSLSAQHCLRPSSASTWSSLSVIISY